MSILLEVSPFPEKKGIGLSWETDDWNDPDFQCMYIESSETPNFIKVSQYATFTLPWLSFFIYCGDIIPRYWRVRAAYLGRKPGEWSNVVEVMPAYEKLEEVSH